jgi:hypothetical protein
MTARRGSPLSGKRVTLRLWLAGSLVTLVAFATLVNPAAAGASVGVGVQGSPVSLATSAHPGMQYSLPPVYVVNTGSEAETISVRVERLSPGSGRFVPPSWVKDAGRPPRLGPHRSSRLSLELLVPIGAASGTYLSDLVVDGSAAISIGRTNLGAAAATKLEFTVAPGHGRGWLALMPPWARGGLAVFLLLLFGVVAFRRSGFRIRVDRAPARCSPVQPVKHLARARRGGARLAVFSGVVVSLVTLTAPSAFAGTGGSTTSSLAVVLTTRSITVSPGTTSFGSCSGGKAPTASTSNALGYPNARCSVGELGTSGTFPITITNTGIAGDVDVNSASSVPADGGTGWILCTTGTHAAVACTGTGGEPGINQYREDNFAEGRENGDGLTNVPTCDYVFEPTIGCAAAAGQSATEGIQLLGPSSSTDTSTAWTVTTTWTAVAS